MVNFLANLYKEGYQYSSINAYRSPISSLHEKIGGFNVGQYPLVTRLIKGIFHASPPLPRYTTKWNVLIYVDSLGDNQNISLKLLSFKLTMLVAHTRPSHSADISQISISHQVYKSDGVVCFILNL